MTIDDPSRMVPPVSPAVESLLAYERTIDERPETVRDRVLERARESLRNAQMVPNKPSPAPVHFVRILLAAAAGVVLVASVAAAFQLMRRSAPGLSPGGVSSPRTPVALPTPDPLNEATSLPTPADPEAAEGSLGPKAPGVSRRTNLPSRDDVAAEELRLLDRARLFAARGDYTSVLVIAIEHERTYPSGRLAEEREVLRMKALVGLGRGGEARHVAARFRHQFPRSVLLPKIDDMLASLR
jgi:hypothetical protein